MSKLKLNVVLAKTDHLGAQTRELISAYSKFFSKNQGDFKGERKTYIAREGTIDEPSKRGFRNVVTTVDEKLEWFTDTVSEYINTLFTQERTNASGLAKAELVVDGKSWGEFTTLELLRLKGFLENNSLVQMYQNIPVRSDSDTWTPTTDEEFTDRNIFETPKITGVNKTTIKESYILPDPNIDKVPDGKYTPQVATKDITQELGDFTHQRFSGEYSHRQRAEILRRRTVLLNAVIEALKKANDVEVIESEMTAEKIFNYLHGK